MNSYYHLLYIDSPDSSSENNLFLISNTVMTSLPFCNFYHFLSQDIGIDILFSLHN